MAASTLAISAKEYTCPLVISMSGYDMPLENPIQVNVDQQEDGKYTMSLINFDMGGTMPVGNIVVKDVEATPCGNTIMLNAQKTIQITAGDKKDATGNDQAWMGPGLGDVNILFKGELKGDKFNALLNIPIAGAMIVGVKLGDEPNQLGQLPNSGFEKFHKATYDTNFQSDEPNGWHSFMSSTGQLKSAVSTDTHTWISEDVRKSDEETDNKYCVKVTSTPVYFMGILLASANGTITTGQLNAGNSKASNPANNAFLNFENTAVDGNGDPFYAVLNNKPDSMKVWVKYHAGEGNKNPQATISALLTNGKNAQDPEIDTYKDNIIARAGNSAIESTDEWQQVTIPFTYDKDETPKAALVTMSTCAVPSGGSKSSSDPDVLYVDDVEMVYNAGVKSIKYKGEEITGFDEDYGTVDIEADGKQIDINDFEVEAEGAGAFVTKQILSDDNIVYVCITVTSNDLKNYVTRVINFNGATTGIKEAQSITLPSGVKAIYNMAGQQVQSMQSGHAYIVKYNNGETKKMIKK